MPKKPKITYNLSCPSNKTYTKMIIKVPKSKCCILKKCSYVKGTPEKRIKVFENYKKLLKKFA
jgi:hypothetical protein